MGITDLKPITVPKSHRHTMLGGDRFYMFARWLVVLLLMVTSPLLLNGEWILPPTLPLSPVGLLIWLYFIFTLLATVAIYFVRTDRIRTIAFLGDMIIISLLNYFSNSRADLFYPLYLIPLIGVSIQMSPRAGVWLGLIGALAYVTSYISGRVGPGNGIVPRDILSLVALGMRALTLIFVPWLASGLAERSVAVNREAVREAERDTERAWSEAQSYRDQMLSLYEVAYTLSTTMSYQSVLDTTLIESHKIAPYTAAMVLLSTGKPDELYIAAARGLSEKEQKLTVNVSGGTIGNALRTGEATLLNDISSETELHSITTIRGCHSACLVPLRAALHTYGLIVLAAAPGQSITQDQMERVITLANYAIIALHNAQLVQDLREERTKLLSKEEDVRHQLARDLHDGPAQALAAITMNVEFIKRLIERDPARVLPELDKLGQLAKRTTYEVRTMLFELRPLALETQGIDVTLQQYLERFKGNGPQIVLEADKVDVDLDTKVEGTLFNIIQESINNALKHAQAKHIWVRVKQTATTLETTVQDDGRGFDLQMVLASYEKRGSFGLLNIEERAKLIGGVAELHSAPNQGTTVRVIVPINN